MSQQQPVFVDIDGTLTDQPDAACGKPVGPRIEALRAAIGNGEAIVLWSARGTDYARDFAERHDLAVLVAVGKPSLCIDDCPTIRPQLNVLAPEEFFGR